MTIKGKPQMNAVCKQAEWDAMERVSPGHHTLIRAGIINESDAERLARSSPVDACPIKPFEVEESICSLPLSLPGGVVGPTRHRDDLPGANER
jgi:hypothetical protein